jgi:Ca2+-binding EF-hand superfamily protein
LFTADGDFTPAADFAIRKVFDSLDEDLDCLLKRGEASAFLMATESQEISDKVWSWIMRSFDSADNGLTPDGFVSLHKWMYNTAGKDEVRFFVIFNVLDRTTSLS